MARDAEVRLKPDTTSRRGRGPLSDGVSGSAPVVSGFSRTHKPTRSLKPDPTAEGRGNFGRFGSLGSGSSGSADPD